MCRESGVTAAAPAAVQHEDKKPRLHDTPADPATADAAAKPAAAPAVTAAAAQGAPQSSSSVTLRPFAVVDEVAEGSPAAAAGIQLGDQLCRCVQLSCGGLLTCRGQDDLLHSVACGFFQGAMSTPPSSSLLLIAVLACSRAYQQHLWAALHPTSFLVLLTGNPAAGTDCVPARQTLSLLMWPQVWSSGCRQWQ